MKMNNGLDVAIASIEAAKEIVKDPEREKDIDWSQYQDNLELAVHLLSSLYVDKSNPKKQEAIADMFRNDK